MRRSSKTGVAMVFIAATLTATQVTAQSGSGTPPQPEGADFVAQGDTIGGLKILNIGPEDFVSDDETDSYLISASGASCIRFTFNSFYASVDIPHGSEVIGIVLHGYDNTASGEIQAKLEARTFGDNTKAELFHARSGSADVDGRSTWNGTDSGGDPVLDKNTEEFLIRAWATTETSNLEICNVQILYFPPRSGGLEFHAINPCAILDTRDDNAIGDFSGKLEGGEVITVDAILSDYSDQGGNGSSCGIPSAGTFLGDTDPLTRAIAINLVALNANGNGNLKAWANDDSEPNGGVLVYGAGVNNGNEFALNVEGGVGCGLFCVTNGGLFKIKNNGGQLVHVRAVVVGYYTDVDATQ